MNNTLAKINQISEIDLRKVDSKTIEIYKANLSQPLKLYTDKNKIVNDIHTAINTVIFDFGLNIEKEDIDTLKIRVTDDIFKSFSNLSIEDIKICFYDGVRGLYGKFFGINPVTFFHWLDFYKNKVLPEVRIKISNHLPKPKEEENKFTQKEVDYQIFTHFMSVYNQLKRHKIYIFNDIGNILWKFTKKLNILNLTKEQEEEAIEEAKKMVIKDLEIQNDKLIRAGKTFQLIDIKKALAIIEEENEHRNYKNLVTIKYKQIAVTNFIKNLIVEKVNIKKIIKTKLEDIDYTK